MKRKPIKVEFLALAMLALITAGAAGLVLRPGSDPDVRHRAALGDVVWNHELHARMKGLTCQVCHHTTRPGVTNPEPCLNCHKEPPREQQGRVLTAMYKDLGAPPPSDQPPPPPPKPGKKEGPEAMVAYHGKCLGCHQAMKQGPVECRDCHAQRFSGPHGRVEWDHRLHSRQMDVECESCHHPVKVDGREEVRLVSCRECHEDAVSTGIDMSTPAIPEHKFSSHKNCGVCHTEENPASTAPDCQACHQKMKPPEGTPPPIEQAIHQKCFDCHNEKIDGSTPRTSGASSCSDCHRKDPSFIDSVFGPVLWTHDAHAQEYECEECHHDRAGFESEPYLSCAACHNERRSGLRIDARMPISPAADAAHEQCLGCHEEKKRGPTACDDCHSRESAISVFHTRIGTETATWDHRFHAVGLAFSCQECHHNMRTRDGLPFTVCAPGQPCPPEAGDAKQCSACHPDSGSAPGPAIMNAKMNLQDALCATCTECHKKLAGPAECQELTGPRSVPPTLEEGNE